MSNLIKPSLISKFSVLSPAILELSLKIALVLPGSTGTMLTYGSPSIYFTTSFAFIPLNSFIVLTSVQFTDLSRSDNMVLCTEAERRPGNQIQDLYLYKNNLCGLRIYQVRITGCTSSGGRW